jgi:hypothetical protein
MPIKINVACGTRVLSLAKSVAQILPFKGRPRFGISIGESERRVTTLYIVDTLVGDDDVDARLPPQSCSWPAAAISGSSAFVAAPFQRLRARGRK